MKLDISARLVAAICQFKADSDIRYYLNGVYVEPIPTGGVLIVGTNGHAMGIWRDTSGEIERPAILRIGKRLESECVGSELKRLVITEDRLAVVMKETNVEVYVQHKDGTKEGSWEVPGKFPDWRRVVPAAAGQCLHDSLNAEYVALARKAIRIGSGDKFSTVALMQAAKGLGIAVVTSNSPDFFGIIMPVHDENTQYPGWVAALNPAPEAVSPLPEQQPSDAHPVPLDTHDGVAVEQTEGVAA